MAQVILPPRNQSYLLFVSTLTSPLSLSLSTPSPQAVAKMAPAGDPLQGTNVAFAVFLPVAAVGLLLGSVYLYISR